MKKGMFLIGMVGLIGFTSCKKQECKRLKESYEIARTNAEMCIEYSYDENGDPMIVYKDCFNNANSISKIRGDKYLSKCNQGAFGNGE